jgi:stage III sporulation protein SpoIIIAA
MILEEHPSHFILQQPRDINNKIQWMIHLRGTGMSIARSSRSSYTASHLQQSQCHPRAVPELVNDIYQLIHTEHGGRKCLKALENDPVAKRLREACQNETLKVILKQQSSHFMLEQRRGSVETEWIVHTRPEMAPKLAGSSQHEQPPGPIVPEPANAMIGTSRPMLQRLQPSTFTRSPRSTLPPTASSLPPPQPQRKFLVDGTTVHYVREYSDMVNTAKELCHYLFPSQGITVQNSLPYQIISVDCKVGAPKDLQLVQMATLQKHAYIFDCQSIGKNDVLKCLEPILSADSVVKMIHDVHPDAKAIFGFGGITLKGVLDTQLVAELLFHHPHIGLNDFLSHMEQPVCRPKEEFYRRMSNDHNFWSKRPLLYEELQYAAMGVISSQLTVPKVMQSLSAEQLVSIKTASDQRAMNASLNERPSRNICFDTTQDCRLQSAELIRAMRPADGLFGEPLQVESDAQEIVNVLPDDFQTKLVAKSDYSVIQNEASELVVYTGDGKDSILPLKNLIDVVLDVGRRPHCWIEESRVFLCDDESRVVESAELQDIAEKLGTFGGDNRAGLDGKLHRFSAIRDRNANIMGITIRVGRHVHGNAAMLMDFLMGTDKSILILGEPGSGKSTIIREVTKKLADEKSVIVVDTSNEIAGDGNTPHSCIGLARRMMVPSLDKQSAVMIEAVQNHTPHVIVIDEVGRTREVDAARTVKQRGVRMIDSAHGDFRRLIKNKELVGLVGGTHTVTIGDNLAREEADRMVDVVLKHGNSHSKPPGISKIRSQRVGEPTFDVIVEVSRASRNEWRIIVDAARAVDDVLNGFRYKAQLRRRDPATGSMTMEFVEN